MDDGINYKPEPDISPRWKQKRQRKSRPFALFLITALLICIGFGASVLLSSIGPSLADTLP
ncbi:MAG: hypothetical protein FWE16_04475 [Firmicutes bacterium]|nr:hypothetical protein [Bacillota bacterium]